jgi:transcriptional regulator with XRE-family HTH domain
MPRPRKDEPSGFARRLKSLREARDLTQDELARQTGLNRFSIAKLEQGRREPNWPTVLRLARALGVDVGAFVANESEATTLETSSPRDGRGKCRAESPRAQAPVCR